MTNDIGFGVIGAGVIAPTHCAAIRDADGARLIAVCDVDEAKAHTLAEKYGVHAYTDLAEMLRDPAIGAVTVCVPSGLHARVGVDAARAHKHVLVEKPIDVSLANADALIEACSAAEVKLGVISQHRFAPDVQQVKRAIEAGEFGQMVLGEAIIKWYRTQAYYDSGDWRGTRALDGGGALMNQSIHYIDLLQWMMGRVVAVKAATITRSHHIEVEDVGVAILQFASGALGTITGSTATFPGLPERLELHGQDGTAILEADMLTGFWRRADLGDVGNYGLNTRSGSQSGATDPATIAHAGHTAQIEDFVGAIRDNRDPAITGWEARRPLEIILAIYQASDTGHEVRL